MKRCIKIIRNALPAALLLLGAAAVSAGVCLLSVPAGIIVAGAECIGLAVLIIRGGGDDS